MGTWQHTLFGILVRRRLEVGGCTKIRTMALNEDAHGDDVNGTNYNIPMCVCTAVHIGNRGHVNLCFFPYGMVLSRNGDLVPSEAVAFRRAVYDEFGIETRLPATLNGLDSPLETAAFDLPPLEMAYGRRDSEKDPPSSKFVNGTTRLFSDGDEL